MLSINLQNAFQNQHTLERTNEAWYQALAAAAEVVNRPGAASYFTNAAADEHHHAEWMRGYLIDRGCKPRFDALTDLPTVSGEDYAGMFRMALDREQITTAAISAIWQMADDEELDPQSVAFLTSPFDDFPGFLAEQTASERELVDYLTSIVRLSDDGLEVFDGKLK